MAEPLIAIDSALANDKISPSAHQNIRRWLEEPWYADFVEPIEQHIAAGMWKELDDAFWTVLKFGTGGRRGRMYPIGCNAINDRTIGESAQGLADYVRSQATGARGQGTGVSSRHLPPIRNLQSAIRNSPAPSPTTPATTPATSQSFAPRSWRPTALRSISSTATAARRSCRSWCARSAATAASWSLPAIIHPATMR
jgi:hypothetical protein